jgi:hypothetical protein
LLTDAAQTKKEPVHWDGMLGVRLGRTALETAVKSTFVAFGMTMARHSCAVFARAVMEVVPAQASSTPLFLLLWNDRALGTLPTLPYGARWTVDVYRYISSH